MAASTDTTKILLKLLVDKERSRVVFAEAEKDFVDVLFSFLTLPMGSIVRLLGKKSGVGSIDRLYLSAAKLDDRCFEAPACRSMLLSPRSAAEIRCKGLALELDDESDPRIFYRCLSSSRSCAMSSVFGARCPCGGTMEAPTMALGWEECEDSKKGFVTEGVNFIIGDDLAVRPASVGASFALINELGIGDDNVLEKKTVLLGKEEILGLLKRSLVSKTPLTDAFLQEPDIMDNCVEKLVIKDIIQARAKRKVSSGNNMKMHMKLFLSKGSDQVVYAEANEELVDLLFSFLTFPLGSVLKLLGKSSLGCMDNLYNSVDLLSNSTNYIISDACKEMLLAPKLAPFFGFGKQLLGIKEALPRSIKLCNCKACFSFTSATRCFHGHNVSYYNEVNPKLPDSGLQPGGGFVKSKGCYLITDELELTLVSPINSIHIIKKLMVPISSLEEVEATIGEAEALDLLGACLISDNVLSDVFSPYLLNLIQQNWLGCFPCKSDE